MLPLEKPEHQLVPYNVRTQQKPEWPSLGSEPGSPLTLDIPVIRTVKNGCAKAPSLWYFLSDTTKANTLTLITYLDSVLAHFSNTSLQKESVEKEQQRQMINEELKITLKCNNSVWNLL